MDPTKTPARPRSARQAQTSRPRPSPEELDAIATEYRARRADELAEFKALLGLTPADTAAKIAEGGPAFDTFRLAIHEAIHARERLGPMVQERGDRLDRMDRARRARKPPREVLRAGDLAALGVLGINRTLVLVYLEQMHAMKHRRAGSKRPGPVTLDAALDVAAAAVGLMPTEALSRLRRARAAMQKRGLLPADLAGDDPIDREWLGRLALKDFKLPGLDFV